MSGPAPCWSTKQSCIKNPYETIVIKKSLWSPRHYRWALFWIHHCETLLKLWTSGLLVRLLYCQTAGALYRHRRGLGSIPFQPESGRPFSRYSFSNTHNCKDHLRWNFLRLILFCIFFLQGVKEKIHLEFTHEELYSFYNQVIICYYLIFDLSSWIG